MTDSSQQVQRLLADIEQQLQRLELWSFEPPNAKALASAEPFCIDTLSLNEWLQWIMLPRMKQLLDKGLPLPGNCNIYGIAEESFKESRQDYSQLLSLIKSLDETLTLHH
ncbi:MAG: YqcC family protein [Motiliproteus sp.]